MRKMKELKLDQKSRPVELGYAMRCARPIGFDLNYTSLLGRGVYSLFKQGYTKCMVTQSPEEEIIPLFLDDIRNTDGRIKTRLVDIDTHKVKSVYDMLHYLTKEDVEAAKEFLSNPEEFVFEEILNWE